jgi:hypothetical protein
MVYLPNVNTTADMYVCGLAPWPSFIGKYQLFSFGPVLMCELQSGIANMHNLNIGYWEG